MALKKKSSTFLNSVPGDQEEVQVDWDKAILGSYLKNLQLSTRILKDFQCCIFHWSCRRAPVVWFLALCCSSHVISTCSLDSKRDVNQHTATSQSSLTLVCTKVLMNLTWDHPDNWMQKKSDTCGAAASFFVWVLLLLSSGSFTLQTKSYFSKLIKWSLKVDGMV